MQGHHLPVFCHELFDEMAAHKPGTAGHKCKCHKSLLSAASRRGATAGSGHLSASNAKRIKGYTRVPVWMTAIPLVNRR